MELPEIVKEYIAETAKFSLELLSTFDKIAEFGKRTNEHLSKEVNDFTDKEKLEFMYAVDKALTETIGEENVERLNAYLKEYAEA